MAIPYCIHSTETCQEGATVDVSRQADGPASRRTAAAARLMVDWEPGRWAGFAGRDLTAAAVGPASASLSSWHAPKLFST